ncbi:SDR family oxidoreductase [Altibacter sp.]|uniref:SDR family oxidoreductase n=1 Tax=Altibacter sp. TaxID=2024823 RepID=UPI00258CA2E5|nr:SDR family oxidoreductase [Altibacter sp.]MCW9037028.1 SDR family oxidoreductase [Altibacter sp.]
MKKPKKFQEQSQEQPGKEHKMHPQPEIIRSTYKGSDKLKNKVALITGGDSGIGRSVAVHFAKEGAELAIIYLKEDKDAAQTKKMVEKEQQSCLLLEGDITNESFCMKAVQQVIDTFGRLDIVVNNAAVQFPKDDLAGISISEMKKTFEVNIYPYFYILKPALEHLKEGAAIINTASVTAYRGSDHLLDYSATKGAIVSFTRSLSQMLADKGIRVNGVAPGPIWTPLIPATFDDISDFGQDTPLGRAGQPSEVAPAYVFLASEDSSYITGQFLHVNGGEMIGS